MATLTLKNVDDELYQLLKRRAKENGRSLNKEAIGCLTRGLGLRPRDTLIEEIDKFRDSLAARGVWVTPEEVDAWINEGRE